jgi:hypothetical protein
MHKGHWFMAVAILVFSGVAAAWAAPVGGVVGNLLSRTDAVGWERVALRRCGQRGGVRHCRYYREGRPNRYRNGDVDTSYYEHDANKLPFGTMRWWDQMQRENRTVPGGGGGRN